MSKDRKLVFATPTLGFFREVVPIGVLSIITYLNHNGFNNTVLLDGNWQDVFSEIQNIDFDIVGVSSVTQNLSIAVQYAAHVKSIKNVPVILGGVHVTTALELPEPFDIGVIGEGEDAMLDLASLESFTPENLSTVKGICYRDNGNLVFTEPRPQKVNLDDYPIPNRDLVNTAFYFKPNRIIPYYTGVTLTMISSRGCPFKCTFCSTSVHWQKFRSHSAKRVVEEMEILINKYGAQLIHIFDDLFIANRKRLFEIRDLVVQKEINKKVGMMCLVRSDMVDDEVMQALKDMNVVMTGVGMESCSDRMLSIIKKGTETVAMHRNLVELSIKYKIPTMASFIVGHQYETLDDLQQTLDFVRSYRDTPYIVPLTYILAVFPGTDCWNYAKQNGIPVEQYEKIVMDIPGSVEPLINAPIVSPLPRDQILYMAQQLASEMVFKHSRFPSHEYFN